MEALMIKQGFIVGFAAVGIVATLVLLIALIRS
jgi:hypothetical protein